ncbi:MAG: helical backbone metal receptor [Bacillota bacterium]
MKKTTTAFLTLLLALLFIVGCGAPAVDNGVDDEPEIEQRIISLMPSNTEILYALGLGDSVVGVTDLCNYPPEMEEAVAAGRIQRVGDAFSVNEELIISLQPTLVVFGYSTDAAQAVVQRLNDLGIATEVIYPQNIEETLASIVRLGEITGTSERAAELVTGMEAAFEEVRAATAALADEERPRVLMLLDLDYLFVAGPGTLEDELISVAGGLNAVDASGYSAVSEEAIIDSKPDIILCGFPYRERIIAEKGSWQDLPAVQAETVYDLNGDLINRPTPRLVEGLRLLLSLIQPEL